MPPLLINSLLTGNCKHLRHWVITIPPAQQGTTYFSFIASHDGIGLRPVEGLLDDTETSQLISTIESFGGKISWRALENGLQKSYEMNISLFDALKGTINGKDGWRINRFICAHTIMLGIEAIPAFYIHSLLATENDYQRAEQEGHNRAINRHQWDSNQLIGKLENTESHHYKVLQQLKRLIGIRKNQRVFHPNAEQHTLMVKDEVFAFWRQSINKTADYSVPTQYDRYATKSIKIRDKLIIKCLQRHY